MIRPILAVLLLLAPAAQAQTSNAEYAAACRAAVGPLPEFSCADGMPVPITVDGVPVTDRAPATCDRPSLLDNGPGSDGQCVPFSRILDLSTDRMQVSVMCRQKVFRSLASMEFDEIDVIAHNPDTGATCWFQASAEEGVPVSGVRVPAPTAALDDRFWKTPQEVVADGCGDCHDNDPFMFSPFVGQVWSEVPVNPFGPYAHVGAEFGFDAWPTTAMTPRDNTCVGCHRIGIGAANYADRKVGSCAQLTDWMTGVEIPPGADGPAGTYPLSHAMPPGFGESEEAWNVIYAQSVAQIRSCCEDPSQTMCVLSQIPALIR